MAMRREAETVYREDVGDRRQAGVRCPRCRRVIAVEWSSEALEEARLEGETRLARCERCFRHPDGDDPEGGYVYVTLEADGRLRAGTSPYDYCEALEVVVSGVASCGCCHVSLVRCGWCGTPVPASHPALETIDEYLECGYCIHCDRILGIQVAARDGKVERGFVDRVASPDERADERWQLWHERADLEMNDVGTWSTALPSIPDRDLALIDLPEDAIEFVARQPRMTWERWLEAFGRDLPPTVRKPPR